MANLDLLKGIFSGISMKEGWKEQEMNYEIMVVVWVKGMGD